jgi:(5-formylfuran-3-yl)methyl phosphate synthase
VLVQLLVSVRSPDEVAPAVAGGADIVDAKEPTRGSLGSVSPDILAGIAAVVPPESEFSIALGDVRQRSDVARTLGRVNVGGRSGVVYLKLGFSGVDSPMRIEQLIADAVRCAERIIPTPLIVPVAYADSERASTIGPTLLLRVAADAGAAGVLLDTHRKDGKALLHWCDARTLALWVAEARRRGLLAALAGGLGALDIPSIRRIGPDVVGVRGAACEGGRLGRVSSRRVRELRAALTEVSEPMI